MSKMIAHCGLVCSDRPTFLATLNDDDAAGKKTVALYAEKFGLARTYPGLGSARG